MSLQLITGSANSGKTGVAYGLLREAVARREQAVLVLPSTPDVGRARSELAVDAPLGLKITTFDGYLADLWTQRGDGRALVAPSGRQIAIAGIATELTGSSELSRLAERCVLELARGTGEAWRGGRGPRGGPGRGLGRIIERYGEQLAGHELIEPAEAAHFLASCGVEHPGPIVFHRFIDLTKEQRVLIRGVAERSRVTVTATVRQGLDAPLTDDWSVNHDASLTHLVAYAATDNATDELAAFAQSVFAPGRALARCAAVRFCAAEGEEAQAIAIAHEVTAAVSEGAASSFDRIAVAFRDVRGHASSLRAALRDAGVPAQFDITRPLRATPLGGALLDGLEFAVYGARASLFSFMRSPFSGVEQAEASVLEARLRRLGVSDPDELLRQLRPSTDSIVGLVAELRAWRDRPVPRQGFLTIAQLVSRAFAAGEPERGTREAREDADVQRAVMHLLESTAELRTQYSLADLVRGLSELRVAPSATEIPGHLQVMPVTRLRGRRFDVVVLGGLNAGEFPASADESMLAGSAVREVLSSFGAAESQPRVAELERMLFYEAVSRARNRLVMVARTSDEEGEAALVSPLLEAAFESYEPPDGEGEPRDHRFDRVYRASGAPDGANPGTRGHIRRDALEGALGPRFAAARRRAALRCGDLGDTSGLVEGAMSPSGIESYLRCPYRWYFERVVRPSTLERGFDARDEGDHSHRLLSGTYERLMERGLVPLRAPELGRALEILGLCAAELTEAMGDPAGVPEIAGRQRAFAWARGILEDDVRGGSRFRPRYTEWSFGDKEEPVALGGLALRGRIDRIDVDDEDRAVVVDYKRTLGAEYGLQRILSEGRVQIPLYLGVVREVLGLRPVAGIYRGLSTPGQRGVVAAEIDVGLKVVRTDIIPAEDMDGLIDAALVLANEAVQGMRAGAVGPAPRSDRVCAGCRVASVCAEAR